MSYFLRLLWVGFGCCGLSLTLWAQQPFTFMPEARARAVLAEKRPDADSQIVALLSLQRVLRMQDFDSSFLLVNQALELVKAQDRPRYAATANRSKGDALFFRGDYHQAILSYRAVMGAELTEANRIQAAYAALGIGKCFLFLGDTDSAKLAYEKAGQYLTQDSPPQHWATYYMHWTEYSLVTGDLDMADRMADSLAAQAVRSGLPNKLAQALDYQGTISMQRSDYPAAIAQIKHASHIYDSLAINTLTLPAYANLGILYGEVSMNDSALAYLFRALDVARDLKDSSTMVFIQGQIAVLYARNGESENSLRYLETTLKEIGRLDQAYLKQLLPPIAEVMAGRNDEAGYQRLMQIFRAQHFPASQADNMAMMVLEVLGEINFGQQYAAAIPKLLRILQDRESMGTGAHPAGPRLWLAQCYLGLSQPGKALGELAQARTLVAEQPSLNMRTKVELYTMQAYHQLGQTEAARQAQIAYEQLQRGASDMRHAVALQEAETRYRTQQIQAERDLQASERQLAEQKARQNLQLAGVAGGGLLMVVLLSVFLYRSREQQRKLTAEVTQQRDQQVQLTAEIAQQRDQQVQLTAEVAQQRDRNETLLRELNHRVKNNLQQISGLLMLQGRQAPQETKDALKVSQQRMETMSLLHTLLYQGEDVAEINLRDYLGTLTHNLLNAYGHPADRITLDLSLSDLTINVDQGIPLGLIANEWITNALKYALPHAPYLRVSLQLLDAKTAELLVADHGPGLPPGFDPMTATSYGLRLVQTMSEQMYGELSVEGEGGTQWRLRFELDRK